MALHTRRRGLRLIMALACAPIAASGGGARATGVPIDGFLPMVGISLTREFIDDFSFAPAPSTTMTEPQLGLGGIPHYDLALLDTGAAVTILNAAARTAFGINNTYSGPGGADGFRGSEVITLGGATGFVDGDILDPLGLYAGGLQTRTAGSAALELANASMRGQINTALVAVPPDSDLPNVLGLSFISQYSTRIRSDQPQIFSLAGQTVRTPSVEFLPRAGGGLGITRKAPLSINGASPVTPQHLPNFNNPDILDSPWEDPFAPTFVSGGLFLNVKVEDDLAGQGGDLDDIEFFFDTGASVTVVSEFNAFLLGFDVTRHEPEFTLAIVGSGGTLLDVPGFFVDKFTIPALGGSIVAQNVPVIVLDIVDPSDPNNVIDGFVGTNLLSGRNLVIDPNPASSGGPSAGLYISDPVTTNSNWATTSAAANWGVGANWSVSAAPDTLTIANVRHTGGAGAQTANVAANSTVWEVNVSGASASQNMTLAIPAGVTLTTFGGLNLEQFGAAAVRGLLDVQFVDMRNGARLSGDGSIATGSGPIPGQVENVSGVVAPGAGIGLLKIEGRFSNGVAGVVEMEILGPAESQYDRLAVDGPITLAGTLRVLLPGASPYIPALGASFALMSTLSASQDLVGEFAALELPTLPTDRMWFLDYGDGDLTLRVTLPGDFDGNGAVAVADLAAWKTGFGAAYDGNEFLAWQRHLGRSLPTLASVPEPTAASLVILAGLALTTCGRRERERLERRPDR